MIPDTLLLKEAFSQIESFFQQQDWPAARTFKDGLSQKDLKDRSEKHGLLLPDQLSELFHWHDGMVPVLPLRQERYYLIPGYHLVSLDDTIEMGLSLSSDPETFAIISPAGASLSDDVWLPFLDDGGGGFFCCLGSRTTMRDATVYSNETYGIEPIYKSLALMMKGYAEAYLSGGIRIINPYRMEVNYSIFTEIMRPYRVT